MSYQDALGRWGAARLAEATGREASEVRTDTVDVTFEYEKEHWYSEHTAEGGVVGVMLTAWTTDGEHLSLELARGSADESLTWSLSEVAGEIAEFDEERA